MDKMWTGGQNVKPWECTWLVIAKQMTFGLQSNVKVLEPNNDDGYAQCDTVLFPVQALAPLLHCCRRNRSSARPLPVSPPSSDWRPLRNHWSTATATTAAQVRHRGCS